MTFEPYVNPSTDMTERKGAVLRYFITSACDGASVHRDESGSVDRCHNG